MRSKSPLIVAIPLFILSALMPVLAPVLARADDTPPPATATRPAAVRPQDTSVPNDKAPPATGHQVTGSTSQPAEVKEMNDDAKRKLDVEGK